MNKLYTPSLLDRHTTECAMKQVWGEPYCTCGSDPATPAAWKNAIRSLLQRTDLLQEILGEYQGQVSLGLTQLNGEWLIDFQTSEPGITQEVRKVIVEGKPVRVLVRPL